MRGLHLTADLYNCRCDAQWLSDMRALGTWARQASEAVGLEVRVELVDGQSVALLLPHSHVCLHTWPGEKAVSADVYVGSLEGDQTAKARGLMFALVNRFQPEWTEQRSLDRGDGE